MSIEKVLVNLMTALVITSMFHVRAGAAILEVGPGKKFAKPSEASRVAKDGDIIKIDAGIYSQDVAVWRQNNLIIRGVGGRAHLEANGAAAEDKGIWVIKGNNIIVQGIEFSGARVRDKNGAGIRQEGLSLTVRNCYFHDNENGILAGENPDRDILVEYSEFANNGAGDARSHNIYIGAVRKFTLQYCYMHHAKVGHNVKSRAVENYILYNRIMDEKTGISSYIVDLPNGGTSYLIGNLLQQGPRTKNFTLVSYAAEGEKNKSEGFYIVNNTFVNERGSGIFIKNLSKRTPAKIINNIFVGDYSTVLKGKGTTINNLVFKKSGIFRLLEKNPGFHDLSKYDYRLISSSPAIDAGIDPGSANDFPLAPQWQYVHVARKEKRTAVGTLDIGAYEFVGK
jgi:hypothetical protein